MWEETSIKYHFHSWMRIRPLSLDSVHAASPSLTSSVSSSLLWTLCHVFFFPHLSHLYCSSIWPQECVRSGVICCWEYRWQELTWCSSVWRFGLLQRDYAVSNDRQWYSCFPCSICKPRCKPPWLHVSLLGPFLLCCKSFLEIFPALLCIFLGFHPTTEPLGKKVSSKFNFCNPLFV